MALLHLKNCVGKIPSDLTWYNSQSGCLISLTIEQLLNKKQASGHKILFAVRELPQYSVTIHEQAVARTPETSCKGVDVEVDIQCSVTLGGASATSKAQKSRHYYDMTHILTVTSDFEFIDFRRIPLSWFLEKWIIYLQHFSQHQGPPRPEDVLCHNPT
jgi:hypothetical protein